LTSEKLQFVLILRRYRATYPLFERRKK